MNSSSHHALAVAIQESYDGMNSEHAARVAEFMRIQSRCQDPYPLLQHEQNILDAGYPRPADGANPEQIRTAAVGALQIG